MAWCLSYKQDLELAFNTCMNCHTVTVNSKEHMNTQSKQIGPFLAYLSTCVTERNYNSLCLKTAGKAKRILQARQYSTE